MTSAATGGRSTAPQPRKVRTRARLLDAAQAQYSAHGIQDASIEDIAKLAGVSIGSLYVHFDSKSGLAAAVANEALDDLEQFVGAQRGGAPLDRVLAAGAHYLRFSIERPVIAQYLAARAMNPEHRDPGDPATRIVDARLRGILLTVAADLREAMDDGDLDRMPVDALLVTLWGLCSGLVDMVVRRDALNVPEGLAERAMRLGCGLILRGSSRSGSARPGKRSAPAR